MKNCMLLAGVMALGTGLSGCAGVQTSSYSYSDSYKVNQPVKGKDCYDASVALAKNYADTKQIAKQVLAAIDAKVTSDSGDEIKAERSRHIGLLVGSGGEELSVTVKLVTKDKSFVTATTKTGFVGGAGQKAWSCQIVDEMIKLAK